METEKDRLSGTVPADLWPRVKEIFHDALDQPCGQRAAFVEAACAGDTALQSMIESLLASDEAAKSFIETPAGVALPFRQPSTASDPGEGHAALLDIGLTRGPALPPSLEVQVLLRRRLSLASMIALGAIGLFYAMRFLRLDFTPSVIWFVMVPGAVYLSVMAVTAALLWRQRVYTLSRLRMHEGFIFGMTTVFLLSETYTPLFVAPAWLPAYVARHPAEMSILARQPSIVWVVLIVIYGTFIPNTGQRCAAVVGSMALCPLVVVAAGGLAHAIPMRSLLLLLSEMALWMGCAVAMAIYGSHKIAVLREEALAARKLGPYQLKHRLGHGGMGDVYLAEHVLLRRPCAIKVIRPEQAGDAGMLQRFLREVQVTATLSHPNTVQVFDYGQATDGTLYYAMEYLTGLNLDELVRRYGAMPTSRLVLVLRQLCGALAEAHAVGLIHRDIKPSNVILCNRGGVYDVVKLLDFGLVRTQALDAASAGLTQAGRIFGTPDYMSPEQAAGNRELDARSDVYSLGALAYFIAVGRPPFVRDSVVQTLAAHINDAVAPLRGSRPEFGEDLESVVLRCLAKDPDDRFPDMTSLERALGACHPANDWTQLEAASWWRAVPVVAEPATVLQPA